MCASYVYILSSNRNGTLYIGVTNNLVKRVWEHKEKIVKGFTAQYGVDKLVYYEEHQDIIMAIQREKQVKKWLRKWKVNLIEKNNPYWQDLFDQLSTKGTGSSLEACEDDARVEVNISTKMCVQGSHRREVKSRSTLSWKMEPYFINLCFNNTYQICFSN